MAVHIVITPLVIARAQGGTDVYLYRGAPVPESIPAAEVKRLVAEGFIEPLPEVEVEPPFPEGDPTADWKVAQLTAYAAAKSIDLDGATKKEDILAKL